MFASLSKPSHRLGSFSFQPKNFLIPIILLAFILRLTRLNFQPLWWDEGYTLYFATRDFATLLDRTALDIHPPLYYALLQLWTFFAGTSDYAVRFFSVAIGALTVPLLYTLTRHLLLPLATTKEGLGVWMIATFLFAIAPFEIYYSQEARMYGLVTLLCLTSTYCFVRLLAAPTRALLLAYILASAAALYTQYYAAFILVFQSLYLLISPRATRITFYTMRPWLLAWASIALLYLPWIIYAGEKLYSYVAFKVGHEKYPAQDPASFLAQHLAAFSIGHISTLAWLSWASILFIALAALGIYTRVSNYSPRHRADSSPQLPSSPALLLTFYLFIPLALGYLVNLLYPFHPIRYERLLLLASPAFFLLVALGIAAIKRRALALAALFILISTSAISLYDYYTVSRYPNDDYRPLIAQMQTLTQPGDNFLAIYPWQIGYLQAYYRGVPLTVTEVPNDEWMNQPQRLQKDLNGILEKNPRVWIPGLQTLGRILEDLLDAQFRSTDYLVLDTWFGTTRLELFQRAPDPPIKGALKFDNGIELLNWGMSTDPVISGKGFVRMTYWGQSAPAQTRTSLRLVDENGNVWAQDDREIENKIQKIGLTVPLGTPPGVYELRFALYREKEPATSTLILGKITVESNDQPNFYSIPRRIGLDFADGMRLVGYDAGYAPIKPGEDSSVALFWQATQKQNMDFLVTVQLQDAFGKTYLTASEPIARGIYNPTRWRGNELVRDPHGFTIPGNLPDGMYMLAVGLVDPVTRVRVGDVTPLTQIQVKGRAHYFGAPSPSSKIDARVGEIAKLVGYDSVRSGRNLRVVLYWQAQERGQIAYKVFMHAVDTSGKIIAQRDQTPGAGEFPTTTWVKGEYLVDVYDLTLPSDASNYQIRVGMYNPGSNTRLPVFDAAGNQVEDFITLK